MKLTIIRADGSVYKDGFSYSELPLASIPSNVHALQWNGSSGWIEFVETEEYKKPSNQAITELPAWANDAVSAWNSADTAAKNVVIEQPSTEGVQTL